MRTLTTLLSLSGAYWALAGFLYPLTAPWQHIYSSVELFKVASTLALLASGYFVWLGWIFYSLKERYPMLKTRGFWTFSLIHHCLCVIYLIPFDTWGGGDDPRWIPWWAIFVAIISLIVICRNPQPPTKPKRMQAAGPSPAPDP